MSDHRRHYLDLNPSPGTDLQKIGPDLGRYFPDWVLAVLAIALLLVQLLAAMSAQEDAKAEKQQAFETHAHAVEEARIEGFRAGVFTATESGCSAIPLAQPITGR